MSNPTMTPNPNPVRNIPAPPGYELNAKGRYVRKQPGRTAPERSQEPIRPSVFEVRKAPNGIVADAERVTPGAIAEHSATVATTMLIALASIHDSPHARPLNEQHADALTASIKELGLLEPILVRKVKAPGSEASSAGYEIMAGAHRAKACRLLGWETIPAIVREADDLQAELILIDENLCRHDLSPAERAKAFKRRKEIYERIHGPAKARGGHAAQAAQGHVHKDKATANLADAFTADAGRKTGKSERAIQREIQRAEALGDEVLTKIVGTSLDKGDELDALAKLSEPRRESLIARAAAGETVTAKTAVKQERRNERETTLGIKQLAAPSGQYGVILEDYEWDDEVWSPETGMDRHAENHYPTSKTAHTAEEIVDATRDRFACAAPECVVFSWTTIQHLAIAIDVMRLRGFTYKSHYVWAKDRISLGRWHRSKHEVLLIGTRGDIPCPAPGTQRESLIQAAHPGPHSAKPDCFYEMIEGYFPTLPKIELNARQAREGWARWGAEAPK